MNSSIDLSQHEIFVTDYLRNAAPALLYEEALRLGCGRITSHGALACHSHGRTRLSRADRRIVDESLVAQDVWWSDVNPRLDPVSYSMNRQQAIAYLNTLPRLYVADGFAGWDDRYRLRVRTICQTPQHALFMHNLLRRPTTAELAEFGEPDLVIYDAGKMPANPFVPGLESGTSVALSFENRELIILGTEYAGELTRGVFSVMQYLMPRLGVLSMQCAANEGSDGDVSLFFATSDVERGLVAADPRRRLIGLDGHCWSDAGVFGVQAGCYAPAGMLSNDADLQTQAFRFGTLLENFDVDQQSRVADPLAAASAGGWAAFPTEFCDNARLPGRSGHPRNVILFVHDAFGVLPLVSQLSREQAAYYFLSGYSVDEEAAADGADQGPRAGFSACFDRDSLIWRPTKYAELFRSRIREHGAQVWLVNTGWSGGTSVAGKRIQLEHVRAVVAAIHDGSLAQQPQAQDAVFGLRAATRCGDLPPQLLLPAKAWTDVKAYRATAEKVAALFHENFRAYVGVLDQAILDAGPIASVKTAGKPKRRRRVAG